MTVEIKDKLYKDISNYCKANHLVIKEYVNELLAKQFMVDKYGDRPGVYIVPDKPVEPPSVKENTEFPPVFTKENGHLEFDKPVIEEKEVGLFPQIKNVTVDYSKTEELKPEVPMTPDEDFIKEKTKAKKRKLK